jgi:hypothetical protein
VINKHRLQVDLKDVTVYVLGANAGGYTTSEWDSLKQFWMTYFDRAGANIEGYSILADPPIQIGSYPARRRAQ